jgi:hypothetical protein
MCESYAILKLPSNLPSTLLKVGENNAILKIAQQPAQHNVKKGESTYNAL